MESISKITLGILLIINVLSILYFKNWGDWMLSNGDSYGYYAYLPMTFIHQDFKTMRLQTYYRTKNQVDHKDENYTPETLPNHWLPGVIAPNGNRVNIYTCGVAILQLPFFAVAHFLAKPLGFAADGYSLPYRFILIFGNLFYVMFGLWFLRKILRGWFSEITTILALSIVMVTTNLYYFTAFNGFMSHSYLFCLVSILLFYTIKFHENKQSKYLIGIGFVGGLITLIRPSDGLFLFFPLLYKMTSWGTFLEKVQLFWSKKMGVLAAVGVFVLPFLPQIIYWKYVTGYRFFNSYGEHFRFDFAHPHIQEGLIGMSNGWLVYTPVMLFALIGIFMIREKRRDFLLPIAMFLPLYIYVIYSWWCFNYINGFGSRPMIETYPLLALPLSIFIEKIQKSTIFTTLIATTVAFLTFLNIFQTWQMSRRIILSEESNAAFWLESFGKTELNYNALVVFDTKELQPNQSVLVRKLFENTFEDSLHTVKDTNIVKQPVANGQFAYRVAAGKFSTGFKTDVKNLQGGRYIKVTLKAYAFTNSIWDIYDKSILVVDFRRGEKELKWRGMRIENKIGNQTNIFGGQNYMWGDISLYIKIPNNVLPEDTLNCYVWNNNRGALIIDDLKIELHK